MRRWWRPSRGRRCIAGCFPRLHPGISKHSPGESFKANEALVAAREALRRIVPLGSFVVAYTPAQAASLNNLANHFRLTAARKTKPRLCLVVTVVAIIINTQTD